MRWCLSSVVCRLFGCQQQCRSLLGKIQIAYYNVERSVKLHGEEALTSKPVVATLLILTIQPVQRSFCSTSVICQFSNSMLDWKYKSDISRGVGRCMDCDADADALRSALTVYCDTVTMVDAPGSYSGYHNNEALSRRHIVMTTHSADLLLSVCRGGADADCLHTRLTQAPSAQRVGLSMSPDVALVQRCRHLSFCCYCWWVVMALV